MGKIEKTNAMRLLDAKGAKYQEFYAPLKEAVSGVEMARIMGVDESIVYKTLVCRAKSLNYYVFVIPVANELNLKKAASSVNEKSMEMIKSKELLPLTGYVHGGCSPIGMKKPFVTVIDESALLKDDIIFSGGKIGYQIRTTLEELAKVVKYTTARLCD